MTSTLPWRRIILHLSHIFFTEGLTFIPALFLSSPPGSHLYLNTILPRVMS